MAGERVADGTPHFARQAGPNDDDCQVMLHCRYTQQV